ncbi:MAG TPA: 50S ribosomal protein L35ae, partial [Candidatus Nanoarchaeia archaeon]|nr:50S ribosomal protein L35ae [Candidatus Nanoarchaeia archaeon]
MEGILSNFRGGAVTQYPNQLIVLIEGINSKEEASKLAAKKVIWTTPTGKEIIGKITKAHGNKGAVRVRFDKGLPGQALGTKVKI